MASGGGGESGGSAAPWSGQEASLKNLYARAADVTERQAQDPFASQGIVGKASAAKQIWGVDDPMAFGANYGLTPGQTDSMLRTGVAPLNNYQQGANNLLAQAGNTTVSGLYGQPEQAMSGQLTNPFGSAGDTAQAYMTDAANGKYLSPDSNPYLAQMVDAANRRATQAFNSNTLPALTAQFSASGRYGSGQQQAVAGQAANNLQQNITDNTANMYGTAYSNERGLQQQAAAGLADYGSQRSTAIARAAALTPQVAEGYNNALASRAAMLNQGGSVIAGQQQQLYSNLANAAQAKIDNPYTQAQRYAGLITGNPTLVQQGGGGGGGGAGVQGAVGGAAAGAAMGSMIMPGYGTAAGAVLGGLYGGFF